MSKKNIPVWLKILGAIGGFALANIAGCAVINAKNTKKMNKHGNENNMMYTVTMGQKSVEIEKDIQNAYITCLTGSMRLTMPEEPTHKHIYINLCTFLGRVHLDLPVGVQVLLEGDSHLELVRNAFLDYEDLDDLPTIHIVRKNILSELVIRAVKHWNA